MLVWVWVVEVLEFNHRKKMVMMSTLILAVLVLLVVASLSPPARRFFKSILAYGGAQADRAADSVRNVDPLGVYRTQIENAVENSRKPIVSKKHNYEINKNVSVEALKHEFVAVLLDPYTNVEVFCKKTKDIMKEHLIPIRPGRSFKRIRKHPKKKFHMNLR